MKVPTVLAGDEVVTGPHGAFILNDMENILPSLFAPSPDLGLGHVGDHVGKAALPASLA